MLAKHFEDLEVWQSAKALSVRVYKQFSNCRDFKFRDQIQSAAVSVMNNIAEGFERKKGSKEMERFLYIAKGSVGEVRSMLHLALEFKYISETEYAELRQAYLGFSRNMYSLISRL